MDIRKEKQKEIMKPKGEIIENKTEKFDKVKKKKYRVKRQMINCKNIASYIINKEIIPLICNMFLQVNNTNTQKRIGQGQFR